MYATVSLTSYILGGIVAALLVTGVSDSPLGIMSTAQFPRHVSQVIAAPAFSKVGATTNVNRSRKGDRLPVTRADPVTNTTIIPKNVGPPEHIVRGAKGTPSQPRTFEIDDGNRVPRRAPAPLAKCEVVASPISDPFLSRFIGRCFV